MQGGGWRLWQQRGAVFSITEGSGDLSHEYFLKVYLYFCHSPTLGRGVHKTAKPFWGNWDGKKREEL